ncbi:PucR family transcriptional regulator [Pseudoclavibacter sp. RFBG4]|uniref:PucR family transcriptional regulator n=1 Tax=Pseudoclavibacter sp. RFBG4 TaxID=2080575 RepID=UPI000CE79269|nr:PucR family transcriptional regulator [Pseudoclavibacter sp. RFBG4]PPG31523.1 PucR family transcriptional regulator [Pseudoclavibacter sp. RFBG4]
MPSPSSPHGQISLAQLLARPELHLEVLVPGDLDTSIRWVATSDLTDPTPYLLGGEFLLTAGVGLRDLDHAELEGYVERAVSAGVVALGLGIDPVFHEVPPALLEACTASDLTLVRIPNDTPFVAVSRTFAEMTELRRVDALRTLADATRRLLRAASADQPETAVAAALAERLGSWAAIVGPGGAVRARAGQVPPAPVLGALAESADQTRGGPAAYPLRSLGGAALGTLLVEAAPPAGSTAHAFLTTAHGMLELIARQRTTGSVAPGQLLVPLLLEADDVFARPDGGPDTELWRDLLLQAAGGDARARTLRVVVACAPSSLKDASELHRWRSLFDTKLVTISAEHATVTLITRLDVTERRLTAFLDEGWSFVVGRPVTAEQLRASAAEVRALERRAREDGGVVRVGADLAPVHSFIGAASGRALAERRLEPLLELDVEARNARLALLRAWLHANGHWDATGRELGMHRNSVRRGIDQLRGLLGLDLDDARVRAELVIALEYVE